MGYRRIGLERFQELLQKLKRKIDLNESTFKHLNVEYFKEDLSNDSGRGEVVTFGGGTTTAGKTYYLNSSGDWAEAGVSSAAIGGKGMLAIALGTSPASHGMLLRGFFDVATYLTGSFTAGATVYLAATGQLTTTPPSTSTEILRVVGVCSNTANIVYFNPSADYLVIE